LGFCRIGFCAIEPFGRAAETLAAWLKQGNHGEMDYLAGGPRNQPRALLTQARSLIVVALPHPRGLTNGLRPVALTGRVARYAQGADYHHVLKERLRQLADACATLCGRPVLARPCVDTAPLLEREAARRSGLGFTGKSTMTIVPGFGSYVLLGELLLDIDLPASTPMAQQCGRCTACLDACPTGAFVDAFTLDARRCISYLTIELRGPIPRALRPGIGRWVFGCDICQEVCPFNHSRKTPAGDTALAGRPQLDAPDLKRLLEISASDHRRLVADSALRRVSRRRLQRNAAVALGNTGAAEAIEPLVRALSQNPSALVRAHCAWALGRLGGNAALQALEQRARDEPDAGVQEEIGAAIKGFDFSHINDSFKGNC
jgi:epoxyqueuosine reductase